jgi:hypothetical protein
MKKIIVSFLIIMLAISAPGQLNELKQQLTKHDYLQKNNSQKKSAWLLAGSGASLVVLGLAVHDVEVNSYAFSFSGKTASNALMVYAAVLIPSSVMLFVVSGRNNNNADVMGMKLNLKLEKAFKIQNNGVGYNYYPALSFKMNLK